MNDLEMINLIKANKKKERKKAIIIVAVFAFVAIIIFAALLDDSKNNKSTIDKAPSYVEIGSILKTKYFDVTVNQAKRDIYVNTGNEFTNLRADKDNCFVILNVTVKNTDNESRMMFNDGVLIIEYQGKDYSYENSETILADGWGFILDNINPLISKTTNIVYRIPREIKGKMFFIPGRSSNDDRIFVGNIE